MKKVLAIVLFLVMMICVMSACGNSGSENTPATTDKTDTEKTKTLSIVTTIFPEYDWVKQILGDKAESAEITLLLDNGVDLHSYQPTADDLMKISKCDMFIFVGGESDEWVEDALATADNKNMEVVNLLEVLGDAVKEEEVVEGMEADHDHEHEHEEIEEDDIQDRTLTEFSGTWKSLYPLLTAGELEEFLEHKAEDAEEEGVTIETLREQYTSNWACDAVSISIDGDDISFVYADGKTANGKYKYAGYIPVRADDGDITGVRYQFELTEGDAPKYVQVNDHGHEPTDEVEHFHIYFGNESFEALMESKTNPFFVPEGLSADEIIEELVGEHHHGEEGEKDEHVWLSLKNAETLCKVISEKLGEIDSENKDAYSANANSYIEKLNALDGQYREATRNAVVKTVLFGDRFPFRYLVDDYGLDYYAAFVGCSAESEASFETIIFLANKIDELGLKSILQIESADGKIAQTIKDNTRSKDQTILTLNSMQSTTSTDIANGVTYLSLMEKNLEVLKDALK